MGYSNSTFYQLQGIGNFLESILVYANCLWKILHYQTMRDEKLTKGPTNKYLIQTNLVKLDVCKVHRIASRLGAV